MQITAAQKLTFEEYLAYDDGTNLRYELVNGQLLPMAPPKPKHQFIVRALTLAFEQEIYRLKLPRMTLTNIGVRTGLRSCRCPDLCLTTIEQAREIDEKSGVFETPPLLAVEVVSPSSVEDDYITKRDEYQATGIPEYWVVDAISDDSRITIHTLKGEVYNLQVFRNQEQLVSATFPELKVTAEAILNA
ncbi:Uma2 family endonuclease [Thermosynechococcaceae cyanobacterium BACA0444]|uniref:Uma2 family endonuclease n=1 Tax=Pseudocalidococcus azoricus BACA0444 TaxID=2918990 RepID=A0AAE4FQN4_9CYAN|nr:Uma2 family endonuclease [Pseudocalidococcus azoricus]MDS3860390.1 Uma2 family endonuclease [Pseudocalidococcus azoricus BACA0444]